MIGWIVGSLLVIAVVVAVSFRPLRRLVREIREERARELFQLQREMLEAKFLDLARSAEEAAGPSWTDCEFDGEALFARHIRSGQFVAFVEVTVHIDDDPVDHPADSLGLNRQATAVFHYHHGQWGTSGRTLYDMTPLEAMNHFRGEYRPIVF